MKIRRILSLTLALVMCLSLMSVAALASDDPEENETVAETAAEEVTEEPVEEETAEEEAATGEEALPAESPVEATAAEEPVPETEQPPATDGATETYTVNDFIITITDGTAVITEYIGTSSTVTVPDSVTINGMTYRIRTVGTSAFEGNGYIQNLTISEGITSLEDCAFKDCTGLSSITIKGNLGDCSQYSINNSYSNSVYYYKNHSVFYNAGANADSLTVTFAEGVTYVPAYLFATGASQADQCYPHVTEIIVPSTVTEIGSYAFYNCYDLSALTIKGNGLTTIDTHAFYNCTSLKNITWGNGLVTIGSYAFQNCSSLTFLQGLPDSLTTIDSYAFNGCSALASVNLPDSLTTIGSYAFYEDAALKSLKISGNLININEHAFDSCGGMTKLELLASTINLGDCAFMNCTGLSSITIDGNIANCSQYSINNSYSNSVYYYKNYSVFYNAGANADSLTVTFGENSTYVPAYLFATGAEKGDLVYAHVTDVIISKNVTNISSYAFYNCHDLTDLTIKGSSLNTIDNYAFYDCDILQNITWGTGLTTINSYAFAYCTGLKTLDLPDGLAAIGSYAFAYDTALSELNLPDALDTIGNYAFTEDTALKSLKITGGTISIGAHAFDECTGITSLELLSDAITLGNCAFMNCTGLSSITIDGNIADCSQYSINNSYSNSIYYYKNYSVFYNAGANASSLTVTFNEGVTYIPAYLFATGGNQGDGTYCRVSKVTIPSTVTEIGKYAFYHCYNLKSITFRVFDDITIGDNIFGDVTATAYYPSGTTGWSSDIRQDYGGTITWKATSMTRPSTGSTDNTGSADSGSDHMSGDITGDGTVNISDVQTLLKYVNGQSVTAVSSALDVNGDNTINISDVQTLLKYVNGQNVTIY